MCRYVSITFWRNVFMKVVLVYNIYEMEKEETIKFIENLLLEKNNKISELEMVIASKEFEIENLKEKIKKLEKNSFNL